MKAHLAPTAPRRQRAAEPCDVGGGPDTARSFGFGGKNAARARGAPTDAPTAAVAPPPTAARRPDRRRPRPRRPTAHVGRNGTRAMEGSASALSRRVRTGGFSRSRESLVAGGVEQGRRYGRDERIAPSHRIWKRRKDRAIAPHLEETEGSRHRIASRKKWKDRVTASRVIASCSGGTRAGRPRPTRSR